MSCKTIQIGILGAARIAPFALIKQARQLEGVQVLAVAEEYQGEEALQRYAKKHRIPRTYRSFNALLNDPDIDAVYIPLPINMHAEWTIKAIRAGKHVLCEKTLCANAEQAKRVHQASQKTDRIVCEAMHFRYHPLVARVREIIASGEIGELTGIKTNFSCYLPFNDFRFSYEMGGGGMIDMGCYPVSFIRAVTGVEPEVLNAKAELHEEKIDRSMHTRLKISERCEADVFLGMRTWKSLFGVSMKITGEHGSISILNFIKPEVYHRLIVKTGKMKRRETIYGESTYKTQLQSFVRAIQGKEEVITTTEDALKNQKVIDAIYEKAGLPVRGLTEAIPQCMRDKVCMITGPTSGIGQSVAMELAKRGAKLILIGRNREKCESVKEDILQIGGVEPVVIQCDLNSLSQVERAAREFLALDLPLHLLLNNAGAVNRYRGVTEDGLEETMAVSYFAAFKLTGLLLDKLKASAPARILNITSNSYPRGDLDFNDLNFEKRYGPILSYATSKLAMVLFSRKLAKELEGTNVTVNAVHPGMIFTNIGISNNEGLVKVIAAFVWRLIAKPASEAHKTTLYAAISPELEGISGQYIAGSGVGKLAPKALDDEVAEKLWAVSQEITNAHHQA